MTTAGRPLPPAAEEAHRILAHLGPLVASELRERLSAAGFQQSLERLQQLPDRFPHRFAVTDDGLICVAMTDVKTGPQREEHVRDDGNWYLPNVTRVAHNRVAVIDIETTGLNRANDLITEIAVVRLDGSVLTDLALPDPNNSSRPALSLGGLGTALRAAEWSDPPVDDGALRGLKFCAGLPRILAIDPLGVPPGHIPQGERSRSHNSRVHHAKARLGFVFPRAYPHSRTIIELRVGAVA